MDDKQKQRMNIYNQYRQVYGELSEEGLYSLGQRVYFDGGAIGEIIWKYQGKLGLMYVLDDNTGFPVEVLASQVEGSAL